MVSKGAHFGNAMARISQTLRTVVRHSLHHHCNTSEAKHYLVSLGLYDVANVHIIIAGKHQLLVNVAQAVSGLCSAVGLFSAWRHNGLFAPIL